MAISATHASAPAPALAGSASQRLHGVDALRGLAAVMVMLFHFTTRYEQKFVHVSQPLFNVPWGFLGVHLFFMVSGFVIFMTLDRTSRPMDFLVSRFSRLYPAYWVAACLSFATLMLFPEIGKTISWGAALSNTLMFEGLFGVPPIDGVYWTLEVELIFYWIMFLLSVSIGLRAPQRWLGAWVLLSVVFGAMRHLGLQMPYVVSMLLILLYIPYFALGMLLYLRYKGAPLRWSVEGLLGAGSLLAIALLDSPMQLISTGTFLALFYLLVFTKQVSQSKLVAQLARVGAISYPLYLLHENMGWTLIHHLEHSGMNPNLAIALACVLALAAAVVLHKLVEQPAMDAIRSWYRARQAAKPPSPYDANARRKWMWGTLAVGLVVFVGNRIAMHG